jgi:hypothetical protein
MDCFVVLRSKFPITEQLFLAILRKFGHNLFKQQGLQVYVTFFFQYVGTVGNRLNKEMEVLNMKC